MCNCDPHKRGKAKDERGEFDWGGCSDNINYGIKFAKAFIDAKERTVKDARALVNLHNNRCGRMVSKELLVGYLTFNVCFCAFKFIQVSHMIMLYNPNTFIIFHYNQPCFGLVLKTAKSVIFSAAEGSDK